MKEWCTQLLLLAVDQWTRHGGYPRLNEDQLRDVKLIAHRGLTHGARDSKKENTLAAFREAILQAAYGVELDLHWTLDDEIVVHHDPDFTTPSNQRVHIKTLNLKDLHSLAPDIPRLQDIVDLRRSSKCRLFIEIKPRQLTLKQSAALKVALAALIPQEDYYLLSLQPEVFADLDGFDRKAFFPVAEFKVEEFAQLALKQGYAGLLCHYLFLKGSMIQRLHDQNMFVGTGFISSPRVLAKEIHRGVDFLFTNHLFQMKQTIASWEHPPSKS